MEQTTLSPSFYRMLCLDQSTTKKQIKDAYRGLMKVYHPDKNIEKSEWATEQTKMLNLAYGILSDDMKRANYDVLLNAFLVKENEKKKEEEKQKRTSKANASFNFKETHPNFQSSNTNSFASVFWGLIALAVLVFVVFGNSDNNS